MARGPIEIPVGVDTGPFEKGVRNGIIDPIEDAQQALEELGGTDAGKDIDRDLKKAQDATQDLDRELDETRKSLGKLSYSAKDVGDDSKKSFGKAEDAIKDMGSEAESTGKEMAASFSEPGDVLDGLQELTANAFAGLGPAGVVAGAAAAAGIGVIADTWDKIGEATEAAKEDAYNYAFAVVESGEIIAQSDAIKEYTSDIEKMKQAQDIVKVSGWDLKDVVTALATGDGLPELAKAFDDGANSTLVAAGRVGELQGVLDGTAQGLEAGAVGAGIYTGKLYELATQSGKATGEVDDLGNAIYELPGGKEVVVNTKTRQASEDLDAFERRTITPKTATVKFAIDTSAYDNWRPNPKAAIIRGVPQAW